MFKSRHKLYYATDNTHKNRRCNSVAFSNNQQYPDRRIGENYAYRNLSRLHQIHSNSQSLRLHRAHAFHMNELLQMID
ncbi:hypothetical protein SAMN05216325_10394 [Nitrosomonas marina]|uniref:Uncharacterized protein n=1 Tax=Nitrosomonas marina TaxID=917 RepID=A0A1H8BTA0_9PROT|nr:hypothetical protein SAMN05216325_10394 [Nitrosomonas marina]